MKCPVCDVDLVMTERSGIEIDYCPKCRGIWLDRGELDKILERSTQMKNPQNIPQGYTRRDDDDDRQHSEGRNDGYGNQRKSSWWQELFD